MSGGDVPCYVGNACWTLDLPIHNGGTIDADLVWNRNAAGNAYLYFQLYDKTNGRIAVDASSNFGGSSQHMSTSVQPGILYQWRVVYASGGAIANFTITATHPN